jgi:hypothetical protein
MIEEVRGMFMSHCGRSVDQLVKTWRWDFLTNRGTN